MSGGFTSLGTCGEWGVKTPSLLLGSAVEVVGEAVNPRHTYWLYIDPLQQNVGNGNVRIHTPRFWSEYSMSGHRENEGHKHCVCDPEK